MIQRAWNTLKSMRFAIVLLVIILAASVVNMFANEFIAPTTGDSEGAARTFRAAYGEPKASVLLMLQMYRPYHSWWYTGLLALLSLSLLVCVVDRAPTVWKLAFQPHHQREPQAYREAALRATISGAGAAERAGAVMKRHGYRVWREAGTDGTVFLDGERYAWANIGAWLVHVGFVLLVLGGAMIARGSYTAQAQGWPGELLAPDESQWGFNVRVDDFQVTFYPLDEGQWVQVDGALIGKIEKRSPDGGFNVEVFRPDHRFIRNVAVARLSNRIDNWDGEGRLDQGNIADYIATLTVIENGRDLLTERVEVNHPLRYKGYRFYQSSFSDQRRDTQGRWTTILSVRKDRGAEPVWAGILLVSLGVVAGLYFVPRRIVAMARGSGAATEAWLTGSAARDESLFAREFQRMMEEIKGEVKNDK